jgi:predicted ArsR family transcriptional regulator
MVNEAINEEGISLKAYLTPIQSHLINKLRNNGPSTRKDLVNILNSPRTTIYDNLLKLQKRKLIEKYTRKNGMRGRPLVFWKVKE